ncbi:MAG: carbohydrate-binding protein, partial [Cytophagales bacterium]|nr:carbohydrate-binding protein [Cytophagales bacterium]
MTLAQNTPKLLATLAVCTQGNYEDGMLGLALDPLFERNGWLYLYYSPAGPDSVQRLSRFLVAGDSLILTSEKVILEVPVQRETCCHSAGDLQFGPDGLLYISTGDNTSSKESSGYSPIDERPGRGPYDAQKSSANTHDLRGKILRVKPKADGSYAVPQGNLFPPDGSQGAPEVYVMGLRNPFRFTVDFPTGYVLWGEVGPDTGLDGPQGPQSYDEFNLARQPGFYGWPYFIADQKAYPDWDFATNTPGSMQDPKRPQNNSPYNYGARDLPPAQPSLIWYPYGPSLIWPVLGQGSRSAMGGPLYRYDRYQGKNKLPRYYDGKWFIYEWARDWIMCVEFGPDWRPVQITPFLTEWKLNNPIDLKLGRDGSLYVLEYGSNYFANNDDARLTRIAYHEGNRQPVARIEASTLRGAHPLPVILDASTSFDHDPDDELHYEWNLPGKTWTGPQLSYTFERPGVYRPQLT